MRGKGGNKVKPLYLPLLALAVVLAFSLWAGNYVEQRTLMWRGMLSAADDTAQLEQWNEARQQLEQTYTNWNSSQTFFHTIMEHSELDEAESLFATTFAACDAQDAPDFHAAVAQLDSQLGLLAETQAISIKNIL